MAAAAVTVAEAGTAAETATAAVAALVAAAARMTHAQRCAAVVARVSGVPAPADVAAVANVVTAAAVALCACLRTSTRDDWRAAAVVPKLWKTLIAAPQQQCTVAAEQRVLRACASAAAYLLRGAPREMRAAAARGGAAAWLVNEAQRAREGSVCRACMRGVYALGLDVLHKEHLAAVTRFVEAPAFTAR